MSWQIRYRPDSALGKRFPTTRYPWRGAGWDTADKAAEVLLECANADHMEIVEVGVSPVTEGDSGAIRGKMTRYSEGPGRVNEPDPSRHRSTRPKGA